MSNMETDASIVLHELGGWMTVEDLIVTMARRDKSWTPDRVRAAATSLILDERVQVSLDSRGDVTRPMRVRMAEKRPGEIPPRECPDAMDPAAAETYTWTYRCSFCGATHSPGDVAAAAEAHKRDPAWRGTMSLTMEDA